MDALLENLTVYDMAAALAHEVKSPLSLVRANIDLLEQDDAGSAHRKNYTVMKRELDKINVLVANLINLTVTQSGFHSQASPVCLKALLKDQLRPYRRTYPYEFRLSLPDGEAYINGDKSSLSLVINNILKNALEAIEACPVPRPGRIRVTLSKTPGMAVIKFRDNGKGLTREESFKLLQQRYTSKPGGSGIGILTSKSIIERHGGALRIDGDSSGCTVTLTLPII